MGFSEKNSMSAMCLVSVDDGNLYNLGDILENRWTADLGVIWLNKCCQVFLHTLIMVGLVNGSF